MKIAGDEMHIRFLGIRVTLLSLAVLLHPLAHADMPMWERGKSFASSFGGLGPYAKGHLSLTAGGISELPGAVGVSGMIEAIPLSHGVYPREVIPGLNPDGTQRLRSLYMTRLAIEADDRPFVRAELHQRVRSFSARLPYVPREVALEITLSDGNTARQGASLGDKLPLSYDMDLRPGLADRAPGVTMDARPRFGGPIVLYACQVPRAGARIKRMQLWIGKHPLFAPDAPLLLSDTVIETETRWLALVNTFRLELPSSDAWQDSHEVEFTATCETAEGAKMSKTVRIQPTPRMKFHDELLHRQRHLPQRAAVA